MAPHGRALAPEFGSALTLAPFTNGTPPHALVFAAQPLFGPAINGAQKFIAIAILGTLRNCAERYSALDVRALTAIPIIHTKQLGKDSVLAVSSPV
jgi:hypothetical protein